MVLIATATPDDDDRNKQIRATKQQIHALVNEIAAIRCEQNSLKYYAEFLPRVITALAANGGAIWLASDATANVSCAYQINLRQRIPHGVNLALHTQLLEQVRSTKIEQLMPPGVPEGMESVDGNPTDDLLVLVPIMVKGEAVGVVEIFQRPMAGPASQRGYLRFLSQMTEHLSDHLTTLRVQDSRPTRSALLHTLVAIVTSVFTHWSYRKRGAALKNASPIVVTTDCG